jgi:hypothetical protein
VGRLIFTSSMVHTSGWIIHASNSTAHTSGPTLGLMEHTQVKHFFTRVRQVWSSHFRFNSIQFMFDTDERSVRRFVLHARRLTLTGSTVRTSGSIVQIPFLTAHITGLTFCAFEFDDPNLVSSLTFSYSCSTVEIVLSDYIQIKV